MFYYFFYLQSWVFAVNIVFETTITENTLKIMAMLIIIDMAIPQITIFTYCGFKLASWICSRDFKQLVKAFMRRNHKNDEDIPPQLQINTGESQPLLHP